MKLVEDRSRHLQYSSSVYQDVLIRCLSSSFSSSSSSLASTSSLSSSSSSSSSGSSCCCSYLRFFDRSQGGPPSTEHSILGPMFKTGSRMIVTNVKAIRSMTAMPLIVTNDNSSVNEIPTDPSRASFALDGIEMSNDHVVVFGQRSIERINSFRDLYQTYHQATAAAAGIHASSPLSRTEMSFRFTILSWWCNDTPISCSSNDPSAAAAPPPQLQADSSSAAQEMVVFGIDRHRTGILLTYSVPSEICRAALLPWLVVRGQVYVESACLTALDDVNDIVSFQRSDRTSIVSVESIDHSDGRVGPRGKIEIGVGPTPTAGVRVVSADPKQQHQFVLKRHHHHLHDFRSIPKPTKRARLDLVVAASVSSVHHQLETQRKKTAVRFQSLMRPAVDTPIAEGSVSSGSRPDAARVGCRFETPGSSVQAGLDDDDVHAGAIGADEEMDGYAVKKTLFPSTTPALDRRRAGPTHQCSAPNKDKEGKYAAAAATTHQWSSLSSLSWVLDHELLRYQCLKNSAKCFFSVPPGSGASPYEQQVERCDRVFMRSAVVMVRPQQTTEDMSSEACAYLGTIGIDSPHMVLEDVLLIVEDPVTHIKRYAVVNPELFMLMIVPGGNNNNNNNDGHLSDGDSSAAAKSSNSLRWEGSRWNVALSFCAFSDMRASGEAAMAVLSALSYEALTSGCGVVDDASATAVHLTWRVVWMDRVT
jgi:hypothetical protein